MINNRKGLDKAVDVEYQELDNRLKNKFIFNKEVIVEDLDVVLNGYLEELR